MKSILRILALVAVVFVSTFASKAQNQIKNGEFFKGLSEWTTMIDQSAVATFKTDFNKATASITYGGTEAWNVQLSQAGLLLEYGKWYEISFTTSMSKPYMGSFDVNLGQTNSPWKSYFTQHLELGTPNDEVHTFKFQMTDATDYWARISFDFGNKQNLGGGYKWNISIDNVVVKQVTGNLITNGNFDTKDLTGWKQFIHPDALVPVFNEFATPQNQVSDITATARYEGGAMAYTRLFGKTPMAEAWYVQLYQGGLKLENGKTYELTFTIGGSDLNNGQIDMAIEKDGNGYTKYLATQKVDFYTSFTGRYSRTKYLQPKSYRFTMTEPTDNNARLVFNMGLNYDANGFKGVEIDNVVLVEVATVNSAPASAPLAAPASSQTATSADASLSFDAVASISNYPNPFQGSTTISYTIPQDGNVVIDVVDVETGIVVKTLVNGVKGAGNYTATFETSTAGDFVCRMTFDSQKKVIRMISVR